MLRPDVTSLIARIHRLRREERGVTAIEFALIVPVLLLLVLGTIEISLVMFAQSVMESATFNASRLGKTGFVASGSTQQAGIVGMLNQRSGGMMDPAEITITSVAYAQYDEVGEAEGYDDANGNGQWDSGETFTDENGNGTWDEDRGTPGYGGAGDIVIYTVSYPWEIFTPVLREMVGEDGIVNITARAVVKNEPYDTE